MNNPFINFEPHKVWQYFYEITQIPRPSKNEDKIIAYLENFAKSKNLEYKKDRVNNIVIRKPASKGGENKPMVALQCHVDMVCEKNNDVDKDFLKDPIEAYIDGEWVKAKGTTLGADDGIGVAMQLAILDSDIDGIGPIECLFTVDEETGLTGANGLENDMIKSKYLINLDSEDEGQIFIGCAGGKNTLGFLPIKYQSVQEKNSVEIFVSGLQGGHSGDDIEKKRGNAIKLLTRIVYDLLNSNETIQLVNIEGGNLHNAIPREATAVLCYDNEDDYNKIKNIVEDYQNIFKTELKISDPGVKITITKKDITNKWLDREMAFRLIRLLYVLPHGVFAWSQDIPDFVETSTNLASIKKQDEHYIITTSQRSSLESAKENICNKVKSAFELAQANVEVNDGYPGWTPNPESYLLKLVAEETEKVLNKKPVIRAIHAGLECGLFSEKFPGLEMVSIGPEMKGVHSPDERLLIPSVKRTFDILINVLKKIDK
ncbi:MAG TPA: aminoacyl-histidine dipeptidase [Bacteroidales bacterium]|jgi:dipeptidase D|nr:aminoacyl-histidine dipeptidase [Bacteroidales bacterium]HRC78092.1 aminoacyl-histidine dipeptidase [Bacteroidales bacterium]HRR53429.1 aminoacyl-histidine dipeptidase [Bacteroidales bacterium]HRS70015.1 aminoacyl-histidine dipeptidase [Bacteroidales bacterium]HRT73207.1 aminoacyl-histidine dipeptidase [Bacteroidales bacterium]